jgi:hypothetical protein
VIVQDFVTLITDLSDGNCGCCWTKQNISDGALALSVFVPFLLFWSG